MPDVIKCRERRGAIPGPTILMPFYHGDNADRMLSALKEEPEYLDGCYAYAMKGV